MVGVMWDGTGLYHHPISLVPHELMASIFIFALPFVRTARDVKHLSTKQSPLNVSHVSQLWRRIALSTACIWTQIYFNLDSCPNTVKAIMYATAIPELLVRSANRALYINVDLSRLLGDELPECWPTFGTLLVRPLIAAQHRWKRVRIRSLPSIWRHGYSANESWSLDDVARAQELDFSLSSIVSRIDRQRSDINGLFTLDISHSSHLQTLTVSADFELVLRVHTCETSSYRNLLNLELCGVRTSIRTEAILSVLAAAPSLHFLALDARFVEYSGQEAFALHESAPIQLRRLRCLCLEFSSGNQVEAILDHLDVPILETLKINSYEDGMPEDGTVDSILNMLHRSRPPLKGMVIYLYDIDADDILLLMEASPTIEDLCVGSITCNYADVFRRLIVSSAEDDLAEVLCPQLEILSLRCRDVEECVGEITQMLISRSFPGGGHHSDPGTDDSEAESADEDIQDVHQARYGTSILRKLQLIPHPNVSEPEEPVTWLKGRRDISELCLRGLLIESG